MSEPVLLLVPVKRWDRAKSRLAHGGEAPGVQDRKALAEAFALDAIAAALACPAVAEVYVVSDEPGLSVAGTRSLPDEGAGDLNVAITRAEARLRDDHAGATVATMCADLPCLVPDDLSTAVQECLDGSVARAFVADADGTGTTFLIARHGTGLDPRFGSGSAGRHHDSGALPVRAEVPTLRRDVDTMADLAAAMDVGLGMHTRAALTR